LIASVENGNVATVLLLLKNGADTTKITKEGKTASEIAKRENKQELVDLLTTMNLADRSTYTAFQNPSNEANLFVRSENTKFLATINTDGTTDDKAEHPNIPLDQSLKHRTSTTSTDTGSQFLNLKSEKMPPILLPFQGFRIEGGKENAKADRNLLFQPQNYNNWYESLFEFCLLFLCSFRLFFFFFAFVFSRFYHSDHYNFVGRVNKKGNMELYEPLIVSVLPEGEKLRLNICSRNVYNFFSFLIFPEHRNIFRF
jgi:hypothetical protein